MFANSQYLSSKSFQINLKEKGGRAMNMVRKLKERKKRSNPKKFEVYASVREYIVDKADADEAKKQIEIDSESNIHQ